MTKPDILERKSAVVIGAGLMGGSIALRLRDHGWTVRIVELNQQSKAAAVASGFAAIDLDECASERGVIVLCTPGDEITRLLRDHADLFGGASLVTDVGSVKSEIGAMAASGAVAMSFVGAHPLAGRAERGFSAADAALYDEATIFLLPGSSNRLESRESAQSFWKLLGGTPVWMHAQEHDALMARISHLPQLLATTLALTFARAGNSPADLGPGGRDMVRLSASHESMWAPLVLANRPSVLEAIDEFANSLSQLRSAIEAGDGAAVSSLISDGRRWRTESEGGSK